MMVVLLNKIRLKSPKFFSNTTRFPIHAAKVYSDYNDDSKAILLALTKSIDKIKDDHSEQAELKKAKYRAIQNSMLNLRFKLSLDGVSDIYTVCMACFAIICRLSASYHKTIIQVQYGAPSNSNFGAPCKSNMAPLATQIWHPM